MRRLPWQGERHCWPLLKSCCCPIFCLCTSSSSCPVLTEICLCLVLTEQLAPGTAPCLGLPQRATTTRSPSFTTCLCFQLLLGHFFKAEAASNSRFSSLHSLNSRFGALHADSLAKLLRDRVSRELPSCSAAAPSAQLQHQFHRTICKSAGHLQLVSPGKVSRKNSIRCFI